MLAPHRGVFFPRSVPPQQQANAGQEAGSGQCWDSWPKGYSTPDDVMLRNKSSGKAGSREDVVLAVFAFPSPRYSR